jgi:hypothetical protein
MSIEELNKRIKTLENNTKVLRNMVMVGLVD